jgi:DNA polymerase III alpha subunit
LTHVKRWPISDLFDFCHRIDLKKSINVLLEALIRAGALDCLGIERSSLMAQLPEAVQAAEQARKTVKQALWIYLVKLKKFNVNLLNLLNHGQMKFVLKVKKIHLVVFKVTRLMSIVQN